MDKPHRGASFLASVTSEGEARLYASLGADIIDAKNPASGALGALPTERVRAIRACLPKHVMVSATVGDPADADSTAHAVRFMAASGVDIVKVGFRAEAGEARTIDRLAALPLAGVRLVGVLLVEHGLDLGLIGRMRDAGFLAVMLDTGDKGAGPLPERLSLSELRRFIETAHGAGLLAGLAGSLTLKHVAPLLELDPDVLGFRGGICRGGARAAGIDANAVSAVRAAVPKRLGAIAEPRHAASAPGRQSETTA